MNLVIRTKEDLVNSAFPVSSKWVYVDSLINYIKVHILKETPEYEEKSELQLIDIDLIRDLRKRGFNLNFLKVSDISVRSNLLTFEEIRKKVSDVSYLSETAFSLEDLEFLRPDTLPDTLPDTSKKTKKFNQEYTLPDTSDTSDANIRVGVKNSSESKIYWCYVGLSLRNDKNLTNLTNLTTTFNSKIYIEKRVETPSEVSEVSEVTHKLTNNLVEKYFSTLKSGDRFTKEDLKKAVPTLKDSDKERKQ